MKWLTSLFRRTEKRSQHSLDDLLGLSGLTNVTAGVKVNENTCLNLSVCFACIKVISEDLASLSLPVYRRLENGGKRRDPSHPLYFLLHDQPNEEQTPMVFRETLIQYALRWGNSYAEIERSKSGQPLALHIIPPQLVEPQRVDGKLVYKITASNRTSYLAAEDILHIRTLGDDLKGYSPIKLAKEAIGLGLATEKFGGAFFGNSARPGGVISHPKTLTEPAQKNLRNSLNDVHGGPENFGKWMILEEGATITPYSIPPDDAQFLATREFQLTELCRVYRVPPHMVGDLSRATFSNVEQQSIDYVKNTLRPWAIRIEQELNRKLLLPVERQTFFCEHLLDSILRGDLASRTSALKEQLLNGALTLDEWRAIEGRNPVDDPSQHFMQGQMRTLEQIQAGSQQDDFQQEPRSHEPEAEAIEPPPEQPEPRSHEPEAEAIEPPPEPPTEAARGQEAAKVSTIEPRSPSPTEAEIEALRGVLADVGARFARREAKAVRKAATHPAEFLLKVDGFYDSHKPFAQQGIEPAVRAWLAATAPEADPQQVTAEVCKRLCDTHREALLELSGTVTAAELSEAVNRWATQLEAEAVQELVDLLS